MENNIEGSSEEKVGENQGDENLEDQPEVKETKTKKGKLIVFSSLVFVIFVIIITGLLLTKEEVVVVDIQLVIEPRELTIDMSSSAQVNVYLQGIDVENREDITDQVEWYTNDTDLFTIGNHSVKGLVVAKPKEGEGFITMIYGEQTEIIPVKVVRAGLSVKCYPLLAEKWTKEGIKTAKVGDEIDWIGFYTEIGSPHYDYKWTGTDGLEGDSAIASKVYQTLGLKEVHFWTKDTAGTIAEADCSIIIK